MRNKILRNHESTKMKVLLVNFDKGWGGGQEQLKSLSLEIATKRCFPHFIVRPESPSAHNFSALGFPVSTFFGPKQNYLRQIFDIARLLRREQFDIVMATREHDLVRIVLAWKLAFPFIKHGKLIVCYHTATRRKQLFLGIADAVLCVSSFIRNNLLDSNPGIVQPIAIIPNGIPITGAPSSEKFTEARQRRFFHGLDFPLIGMVGAFFKNQVELIEIIPLLKREFPSIKIALIGDDTDPGLTGPIKAKARLFGVTDSLIFTGKVPHEQMADLYFDLDLTVSTFRNEGFGLIHLESLAAGTPVVAYNKGGQVDIFKGNNTGTLVEGGAEQFSAAVADLLREKEKRFAMGREGVDLVLSSFSIKKMGQDYIDFFTGLIYNTHQY